MVHSELAHNPATRLVVSVFQLAKRISQFRVFAAFRQVLERLKWLEFGKVCADLTFGERWGLGQGRIQVSQALNGTGTQCLAQKRCGDVWMTTRDIQQRANRRRHLQSTQAGHSTL